MLAGIPTDPGVERQVTASELGTVVMIGKPLDLPFDHL
jgi:hypothetical protein